MSQNLVRQQITEKLKTHLQPTYLEVVNESHMHNVPPNSETHFKVVIVSDAFQSLSRIDRQRRVNEILKDEIQGPVHALSQKTWTPEEWEKRGQNAGEGSPQCLGGEKKSLG